VSNKNTEALMKQLLDRRKSNPLKTTMKFSKNTHGGGDEIEISPISPKRASSQEKKV
jgi:hypothetical protein